jgi:hypothetical protein
MKPTILVIFFCLLILSCGKEPDMSDAGILSSHGWKIESVQRNGVKTDSGCLEDDCYSFNKDGSLTISYGRMKCTEVESPGGTYWFYDDETLVINSSGERIYYKIFVYTDEVVLITDATGSRMIYIYVPCN